MHSETIETTDEPLSDREVEALDALTSGVGGLVFTALVVLAGIRLAPTPPNTVAHTLALSWFVIGYSVVFLTLLTGSLDRLEAGIRLSESPPRGLRWLA